MTLGARNFLLFDQCMSNRLCAGFLDGLCREIVTQLAFAPTYVNFSVFEMTERTGCFAHLEMKFLGQMLMTAGTSDFHAIDLLLAVKMRLMHELYFFIADHNFFGQEGVVRAAMAVRCQTVGIND